MLKENERTLSIKLTKETVDDSTMLAHSMGGKSKRDALSKAIDYYINGNIIDDEIKDKFKRSMRQYVISMDMEKAAVVRDMADKFETSISEVGRVLMETFCHKHQADLNRMKKQGIRPNMAEVRARAIVLELEKGDLKPIDIAKRYGLSRQMISLIQNGQAWNGITGIEPNEAMKLRKEKAKLREDKKAQKIAEKKRLRDEKIAEKKRIRQEKKAQREAKSVT